MSLFCLHCLYDNVEKLMKEAIHKTATWLNVMNVQLEKPDSKLPVDQIDMTTLQTQIKEHNKRIKDYMDRKAVISVLKVNKVTKKSL